jgi:GTP cyclohydrolase I
MEEKKSKIDREKVEQAVRLLLEGVGEDPERRDLLKTPSRVADMFEEILSGMWDDPTKELTVFQSEKYDQMLLIKDIPVYSMCEHHMLPFIGKAHVAYIPDSGRVTGLSKLVRVVHAYMRRLQVQENLTEQIASTLMDSLKPKGVMVVIEAEHLCMSMRGVQQPGTVTVTSSVKGIFRSNRATREETLSLISKTGSKT